MKPAASAELLRNLRRQLPAAPPFSAMSEADQDFFLLHCTEVYFAPDELVLQPSDGPVTALYLVRQGEVSATRGSDELPDIRSFETGELFPLNAAVGRRAVRYVFRAVGDTFCLRLPLADMQALIERSAPFAAYVNDRLNAMLDQSRAALRSAHASQAVAQQSLETPLGQLGRKVPYTVGPEAPLREALQTMHDRRIGSVLVVGGAGELLGIFTRHDVLSKVTLPALPLDTPIRVAMSAPVQALTEHHSAHDAAFLMSRHGIRHVPVLSDGRLIGIVSERDLFALQRLSIKNVSASIRTVADVEAARAAAADIRKLVDSLLGQGVGARQITGLVSHLNDLLSERLVELAAAGHGLLLEDACWIALGSEGRGEQTLATDQDNALVFLSSRPDDDRDRWLAFAQEVNKGLDACGFPLCKGGVMAGNPPCCLTPDEWIARFSHWIDHGSPEDLLRASIFFDFRAVAGRAALLAPMRSYVTGRARAVPRFLKQLAVNALRSRAPVTWRGGIDATEVDGRPTIDLKLNGTALMVDVARIYALAYGVEVTGTRERLLAVGNRMPGGAREAEAWVGAFDFLQTLRLSVQTRPGGFAAEPNRVDLNTLNEIDRRILKEALRVVRSLQQRLEMDWCR